MKISHASLLPAPMERVAEVLCGEAYNLESEKRREGVISTRYQLVEKTADRVVFDMHTTEHGRTKTGGMDRSATVGTVLRNTYVAAQRTLTWVYQKAGGSPSRLKLSGVYRMTPEGSGTRVVHEVEIAVDIPLIGGQIAKFIGKEFQRELPEYDKVMKKHLAGS